jgi:hypothetical protein
MKTIDALSPVILIFLSGLWGCSKEMPVEFNNTYDLKSDRYIPEFPMVDPVARAAADTGVFLTWTDCSGAEDGFIIDRNIHYSSTYTVIDTIPANATTYFHATQLANFVNYGYRIRSFNRNGSRGPVGFYDAMFFIRVPITPGIKSSKMDSVTVQWTYGAGDGPLGYYIERSKDGGAFGRIAEVGKDVREYQFGKADTASTYAFRFQAFARYNVSAYSATLRIKYGQPGWYAY